MTDALSFNKETNEGGMDGSIIYRIDQPGYAKLKAAAAEVERIRADLVDKTQVTRADLIAFGGAVAIEATGKSSLHRPSYRVQINALWLFRNSRAASRNSYASSPSSVPVYLASPDPTRRHTASPRPQ
jgi:hypothetical protein